MKELEARTLCLELATEYIKTSGFNNINNIFNKYYSILTDNGRLKFEDKDANEGGELMMDLLDKIHETREKAIYNAMVEYPSSINVTSRTCG